MDRYIDTSDQTQIHYEISGQGDTALFFAHGWLGSARWWDAQRDHFSSKYLVVQVDMAGHGKSTKTRTHWSAQRYAQDLSAVADQIDAKEIVLIGHSMSGAYAIEAFPLISKIIKIVLVDTLKDLGQLVSPEQTNRMFAMYRKDFKNTVQTVLPQYLFTDSTPTHVRERILSEFLASDPSLAVAALEPLYKMNVQESAKRVTVPVRAINSLHTPTHLENNRSYFKDYDFVSIAGTSHYPMLEKADEFNRALERILE